MLIHQEHAILALSDDKALSELTDNTQARQLARLGGVDLGTRKELIRRSNARLGLNRASRLKWELNRSRFRGCGKRRGSRKRRGDLC
jgi:hypothetical protein